MAYHHMASRYYPQLAQMSVGLFVGVLALMTFLLTVGLQHGKVDTFVISLDTALVSLGVVLVAYTITHFFKQAAMMVGVRLEDQLEAKDKRQEEVGLLMLRKRRVLMVVKALRVLQALAFLVGVIAVVVFSMEVA